MTFLRCTTRLTLELKNSNLVDDISGYITGGAGRG
jgi:phosphotransferase system IIB component